MAFCKIDFDYISKPSSLQQRELFQIFTGFPINPLRTFEDGTESGAKVKYLAKPIVITRILIKVFGIILLAIAVKLFRANLGV